MPKCAFCNLSDERIWLSSDTCIAIRDGFPVSQGHTLVIPNRHVALFASLPRDEQISVWEMVEKVRGRLMSEFDPDGFNVGLNDGAAAGQTIPHVHVHIIPRWEGDVEDPRGGIRWVIPEKARYWD